MSKRKIDDLLHERHQGFSPLQKLLRQANNQTSWSSQLKAVLPDAMARDCSVTDVRGTIIMVSCSNAGTATRLRFMAPELVIQLRQLADFRAVQELHIKVSAR